MPMPHLQERNKLIIEDRAAGMTLKAVGLKHGVSPERVRQLVLQYDRIGKLVEAQAGDYARTPFVELEWTWFEPNGVRASNAVLCNLFYRRDPSALEVLRTLASYDMDYALKHWPNFGKKSAKLLTDWVGANRYRLGEV